MSQFSSYRTPQQMRAATAAAHDPATVIAHGSAPTEARMRAAIDAAQRATQQEGRTDMNRHRDLARQLTADLVYRSEVRPHISAVTEGYGLANAVASAATGVSRRAVDNRWCADWQGEAFLAHHAAVLDECREIARLALSGAPGTATNRLARLLSEARASAPGARTVTVP